MLLLLIFALFSTVNFSLASLLYGNVEISTYSDVDCGGIQLGKFVCDGKTCNDFSKAESMQVKIV
jgi:hypothetical protein